VTLKILASLSLLGYGAFYYAATQNNTAAYLAASTQYGGRTINLCVVRAGQPTGDARLPDRLTPQV